MSNTVNIISLGCDKNTVDSENMLGYLTQDGFMLVPDPYDADLIIINSCCFIEDALQESIDTVIEIAMLKSEAPEKKILLAGCMSARYKDEIFKELPEVDGIIGTYQISDIANIARDVLADKRVSRTEEEEIIYMNQRGISSIEHYAYLKIAEGCDKSCSYCVIPSLRGKYISRKIEDILSEAEFLAGRGKNEIIIIAQDSSYYGKDLYGEFMLSHLLRELCKIEGIKFLRILYSYPENITDELIETIKSEAKICKYLDMPLQHADDKILNKMTRQSTEKSMKQLIEKLRTEIPEIIIRSTFIVGFPGEDEESFNKLYDFVKETAFDRLGVFKYSREKGTKAYDFENQVEETVKISRYNKLMEAQQEISYQKNLNLIGKTFDMIVDGKMLEDNVYVGRTYMDAPNIDGMLFVSSEFDLISGSVVRAKITKAKEYDLLGEIVSENESC